MADGTMQFAFEPEGTMVKRLHGGIPTHNGVVAAQLSRLGVSAPMRSHEGEAGFMNTFGKAPESALLKRPHNAPLEIYQRWARMSGSYPAPGSLASGSRPLALGPSGGFRARAALPDLVFHD